MKAKVIQKFKDKNTKEIYKVGQEIEVTKERFKEMNSTPNGQFVEEVKQPKEEPKKEPKKEPKQGNKKKTPKK